MKMGKNRTKLRYRGSRAQGLGISSPQSFGLKKKKKDFEQNISKLHFNASNKRITSKKKRKMDRHINNRYINK